MWAGVACLFGFRLILCFLRWLCSLWSKLFRLSCLLLQSPVSILFLLIQYDSVE